MSSYGCNTYKSFVRSVFSTCFLELLNIASSSPVFFKSNCRQQIERAFDAYGCAVYLQYKRERWARWCWTEQFCKPTWMRDDNS